MTYDEAFELAVQTAPTAVERFPVRCRCGAPLARARTTRAGVLLDAAEADEDLRTSMAAAGVAPVAEVPVRPLQVLLEHPQTPKLPERLRLVCARDRGAHEVEVEKLLDAIRRVVTIGAA